MKRLMLLLAFLISVGTSAWGQDEPSTSREVDLTVTEGQGETGTQGRTLAAALGDEANSITELKIIGPLTAEDFATLKNMARLQVLDMSGVTELLNTEISWYDNEFSQNVTYKSIPQEAFQNKLTLQKVILPACAEVIGSAAFKGCSQLIEIEFATNNNLKYILSEAFKQCSSLRSVDLSDCSNIIGIRPVAFYNCTNLIDVNLSGCTSLTSIGYSAFSNCSSLQTIDMSSCTSLLIIGQSAFSSCSLLTTISLTNCTALKTIDGYAFSHTSKLNAFDFTALTALETIGRYAFQASGLSSEVVLGSSIKEIGEYAFANSQQLINVSFAENSRLTTLSAYSLADCSALRTVDFSNCTTLGTIGDQAFSNCYSLQSILIDNNWFKSKEGVLFVVDCATLMVYPNAKELESYTIPNTVQTIITNAFDLYRFYEFPAAKLQELIIPTSVLSIQPNAFSGFDGKTVRILAQSPIGLSNDIGLKGALVYVPKGSLTAYKKAAVWKDYTLIETGAEGTVVTLETAGTLGEKLSNVDLGTIQELTVNGPMNASDFEVIKQMSLLIKVDLGGATMAENKLPNSAFDSGSFPQKLSYLKEVILPNSITEVGDNAFGGFPDLEKVNLPTSLEVIGSAAFISCTSLQEIDLSNLEHLRKIGSSAFQNCSAIPATLKLPNTLESLGSWAFAYTKVTSVDFSNIAIERFESNAFYDCAITGKLSFPATLTSIGNGAFNAATPESIKLKSAEMVRLGGTDVFKAAKETACNVYVPKGLGATYKADTYWSPFGNNIVEYGYLVTATTNNSDYGTVSGGGAYEAGETVTLTADPNNPSEYAAFGGWYENNQRVSSDLVYTFIMGTSDRIIEARFYWNGADDWWEERVVDDSNKIDGLNISASRLTVNGELPWALNSFVYKWPFHSYILVNSPMSATTIEVKAHPEELCVGWNFISLPYDVKISDIGKPYESSQFVIRYYDGASRAAEGMGGSWKQLGANDVVKANQGYIMRTNGGSPEDVWYTFNSSIDDMNKLFNHQAVTIPLPAHASNVPADANWNLVGNPFPCYFSVKQLFDDGLDGTVTVWSDDIQNYDYYTQDDEGVYLAPLTAFFIQHSGSTSRVTFKPEGRVAALPTTRAALAELRSDMGREVINLQLANDSLSDKTRVVFNEAASTDYELGKDAAKFSSMNNNAPSLYSLDAQNQQLAINERPVGNGLVRLGCYIGVKGSYTLSAKETLASDLYLYDTETGASCNLRETSYTFTAEAGVCNNRFELRTSLKGTGVEAIAGFSWQVVGDQLQLNGLPVGATVSLFDANGRMRFTGDATTAAAGIALPQNGIYYLIIRTAEGVSSTVSIKR